MSKTGLVLLGLFALTAILSPVLTPYHPTEDTDTPLQPPSSRHLLGTDDVGRDILSQVIAGTRISLIVGLTAGVAATMLGVFVGLTAGYFGGAVDRVLMRTVDFFLAIPRLPLLLVLSACLGGGIRVVVVAFVLVSWAFPARVIRAQTLLEKKRAYVTSARLSGAGFGYILRRHLLGAVAPLVLVVTITETGYAIATEAGLSFLGLGDATAVSWGTILHHALAYPVLFENGAWLFWALPPGLCLSLLLLGLALVGMSLEARLDPRLKGGRLVG